MWEREYLRIKKKRIITSLKHLTKLPILRSILYNDITHSFIPVVQLNNIVIMVRL